MPDHDVLVVGGGPAGASRAYWLAEAGHDVLLLEKKRYPREKTCGDGLTPRSVRQLHDMGLADDLTEFHRFDGLRSIAFGRTLELAWPSHPDFPSFGYVITRKDLDHLVAERAAKAGNVLPGYGWIFPVGDGRVNVGIGLLSTFNQWKAVNTSHLMESFVDYAPASWGLSPETSCGPPTGGKLPMALSVGPHAGPTWLVAGDAGGSINPFNGEGIAYAYETGRMAADAVSTALRTGDGLALQGYEERLRTEYALYFKVAKVFVKIIGRPELMRALVSTGMRSRTLMEWVLRIMANMLRPDELGPAEAAYRAVATLARVTPGP